MLKNSFVSLFLILAVPALPFAQEKKTAAPSNGVINVFPNCELIPGNLIRNCGFETGTFEGWTLSGDIDPLFTSVTTGAAHSGTFGAQIGPRGFTGFLTQVVSTTPGQTYDVSLWMRSAGRPNQFMLFFDGTMISNCQSFPATATPDATDAIVHEQMFFPRMGPVRGSSAVFTVGFFNPTDFFFVDDVVMLPSTSGAQTN